MYREFFNYAGSRGPIVGKPFFFVRVGTHAPEVRRARETRLPLAAVT